MYLGRRKRTHEKQTDGNSCTVACLVLHVGKDMLSFHLFLICNLAMKRRLRLIIHAQVGPSPLLFKQSNHASLLPYSSFHHVHGHCLKLKSNFAYLIEDRVWISGRCLTVCALIRSFPSLQPLPAPFT